MIVKLVVAWPRLMPLLTRRDLLIEEQGMTYLAESDSVPALTPLQAASCTYRIALGPRAGQKVLSLRSLPGTQERSTPGLCANLHGFSLHAAVRCGALAPAIALLAALATPA